MNKQGRLANERPAGGDDISLISPPKRPRPRAKPTAAQAEAAEEAAGEGGKYGQRVEKRRLAVAQLATTAPGRTGGVGRRGAPLHTGEANLGRWTMKELRVRLVCDSQHQARRHVDARGGSDHRPRGAHARPSVESGG